MKKQYRMTLSILLCMVLLIGLVPVVAQAALSINGDEFNEKLNYYATNVYKNGSTYTGGGQCFGFANDIAEYIFGSYPITWYGNKNSNWDFNFGASALNSLHVGDIVRFKYGTATDHEQDHSIFVTAISASMVTFSDGNFTRSDGKPNIVRHGATLSLATLSNFIEQTLDYKVDKNGKTILFGESKGFVAHYKGWNDSILLPPAAPSGLTGVRSGSANVQLTWTAVSGATSYEAQYSRPGVSWTTLDESPTSTNSLLAKNFTWNYEYVDFRVRAVNAGGVSGWVQVRVSKEATVSVCDWDHSAGGKHDGTYTYKTVKKSDGTYTAVCKNCGAEYILPALDISAAGTYQFKLASENPNDSNVNGVGTDPYRESCLSCGVEGAQVTVIGAVKNAYGNVWYKTSDGKYVYSAYLTKVTTPAALNSQMVELAKQQNGKKASDFGFNYDWCAQFVGWCARQLNLTSILGTAKNYPSDFAEYVLNNNTGKVYYFSNTYSSTTGNIKVYLENNGIKNLATNLVESSRDSFVPEPGDLICFLWQSSASQFNWSHIGIVKEFSSGHVYYIDGNHSGNSGGSDGWKSSYVNINQSISKQDKAITCYIRPDYSRNGSAPTAPTKLTAKWGENNSVILSWDSVIGATSYKAEYSHEGKGWTTDNDYKKNTETSYTSSTTGKDWYKFRVCAVNAVGQSEWTEVQINKGTSGTGNTTPVAPAAPSVTVNGSSVTVSWNDVANETSYDVYLVQSPWKWSDIKYVKTGLAANTTSFTFTNVADGYYKAFVIARPNANKVQSGWTSVTVKTQQPAAASTLSTFKPIWPIENDSRKRITTLDYYLNDSETGYGSLHKGIDIVADIDKSIVKAVADGTVIHIDNTCTHNYGKKDYKWDTCGQGCGNYIVIEHAIGDEYYYSVYMHLTKDSYSDYGIYEGAAVHQGDQIARAGSTGWSTGGHLHLELMKGDLRNFTINKLHTLREDVGAKSFQYYLNNLSVLDGVTIWDAKVKYSKYFATEIPQKATLVKIGSDNFYKFSSSSTVAPAAPSAPHVTISGSSVTVSWNDVADETSYDVYLVQSPWKWSDIKYAKTGLAANTTSCTFTNVADGYYKAFVIARPNANKVQSGWTSVSVKSSH